MRTSGEYAITVIESASDKTAAEIDELEQLTRHDNFGTTNTRAANGVIAKRRAASA